MYWRVDCDGYPPMWFLSAADANNHAAANGCPVEATTDVPH